MMTEDRFLDLVGAYGADPGRWPLGERAAAAAFIDANADVVAACLAAERALDAVLAAHPASQPSAALRQRIIATAPTARSGSQIWRWLAGAGLGLGLAASGAAGVAAGFTLAPPAVTRLVVPAEPVGGEISSLADPVGDASAG
ncbi:MAG TPA: hypothetical protein VGI95_03085 [Caulobacteraceae bacterium]|jgi:hypothetical protein